MNDKVKTKNSGPDGQSNRSFGTILSEVYSDQHANAIPPVAQTSTSVFENVDALETVHGKKTKNNVLGQASNPTISEFERIMAKLDGADDAIAFATAKAAITSVILSVVGPGERMVCVQNVNPETYRLIESVIRPLGIKVSYHPVETFHDNQELLDGVKLAFIESPCSFTYEVTDLDKVAANAKQHSTVTVLDNSWATPVLQRPLVHGMDMAVYSASNYLSGHGDVAVSVVTGKSEAMQALSEVYAPLLGAQPSSLDAWLSIRGLRTLELRLARHAQSAEILTDRLSNLSQVQKVNSAKIDESSSLEGQSGLFSIELDSKVSVREFCNALSIFRIGTGWGSFNSLVYPTIAGRNQEGDGNMIADFYIPENLVSLSVGLESVEDLWNDLKAAIQIGTTAS